MNVSNIIFADIEYGEDIKVEFYGDSGLIKKVMGPKTGNGRSFASTETATNVRRIVGTRATQWTGSDTLTRDTHTKRA